MDQHIVQAYESGWTLRKWARYHLPTIAYPTLAQLARKKLIRVDGKNAKLNDSIQTGQKIELKNIVVNNIHKIVNLTPIEKMIVYENEDFAIIEKPYGMCAQGQDGSIAQLTNAFIVHRLDKITSGLMVLAKTKLMADILSTQFREHKFKKTYHARLSATLPLAAGRWDNAIDGKEAITEYNMLSEKFMELRPVTGRKHQLRIHTAMHGAAILGDTKYGSLPAERVYLHCARIEFEYEGKIVEFESLAWMLKNMRNI